MEINQAKVAALEKAIVEKYGPEAVHNPRSSWDGAKEEEYIIQRRQLLEKERSGREKHRHVEVDGFLISERLIKRETNRSCQVCNSYSFVPKDEIYLKRFKCCYSCYLRHVEGREQRWMEKTDEEKSQHGRSEATSTEKAKGEGVRSQA